jgi:23S rRNA pseudouridine2605 synthase
MAMQLVKYMAHAGVCSRRDAVLLIRQQLVTLNGVTVQELNTLVNEGDVVKVKGKVVKPESKVYLMLHKPVGYICTNSDEQERKTIFDLLPAFKKVKLFTVGRLDKDSSGLLLVTNDGDWAQKLAHPSFEIKKEYQVVLNKPLDVVDYNQILKGVRLPDGMIRLDKVVLQKSKIHLKITIHSGKNRIIRRIFEHLGYKVRELKRVRFGNYGLEKLPVGCYRQISSNFL